MTTPELDPNNVPHDKWFAVRLMEHLVVPTFVVDAAGKVMIWNRACERLTGWSASEMLNTRDHWRAFYSKQRKCLADLVLEAQPENINSLYVQVSEFAPGHVGLCAENWCTMPRLSLRRYLAIDAGPIYSDSGELLAVVETLRDITAQKEAQKALEAMANMDGLTKLHNRRSFDERLKIEWARASRESNGLALLMIDIDHFKLLNDTLGHQVGDKCIKMVASKISREMKRAGDFAARYGGEEFVVLLPNTTLIGASHIAECVMRAIAVENFKHPASETSEKITISIGLAHSKSLGEASANGLLLAADKALYRAKNAGRDRLELAVGP